MVIAQNRISDIEFPILTDFKMEVFREGQLSEKNLLVRLEIWKLDNRFFVSWNHIHIEPVHSQKKVCLIPWHFSTEASIKNVRVHKNGFSFRIDYLKGYGLTADVVGTKKGGQDRYYVEANAIAPVGGAKKSTEIWRSTDEKIVLPYKEVF